MLQILSFELKLAALLNFSQFIASDFFLRFSNNPVSNHLRHDNEDSISSASEALKNYIDKYEREQLTGLASSITNLCTETPLQRQNISWSK